MPTFIHASAVVMFMLTKFNILWDAVTRYLSDFLRMYIKAGSRRTLIICPHINQNPLLQSMTGCSHVLHTRIHTHSHIPLPLLLVIGFCNLPPFLLDKKLLKPYHSRKHVGSRQELLTAVLTILKVVCFSLTRSMNTQESMIYGQYRHESRMKFPASMFCSVILFFPSLVKFKVSYEVPAYKSLNPILHE